VDTINEFMGQEQLRFLPLAIGVVATFSVAGPAHAKPARERWVTPCVARMETLKAQLAVESMIATLDVEPDRVTLWMEPSEFVRYSASVYRKIGDRPAVVSAGDKPAPKFGDEAWHTYHMEPPPHDRDVRVTKFRQHAGLEAFCFMRVDPLRVKHDVAVFENAARAALDACLEAP
jgi:hypothetical protein